MTDDDRDDVLLTAEEAADLLRLNRNTLYELVREGQVPALRLGRSLRFHRGRLLDFARRGNTTDDG